MNTFLFDLDGTLLPMNQERFIEIYFKALAIKTAPFGFDAEKLIKYVWIGTKAMIENDGTMTNEQRFWKVFSDIYGEQIRSMETVFNDFYQNEFIEAKKETAKNPLAKECIKILKEKGYRLVLATNPVFPKVATYARIEWAGLDKEDFEIITTYENSSFCKPNLKYYNTILDEIGCSPNDCIMVGNDRKEDMCSTELGMKAYLIKDCIIESNQTNIGNYDTGSFEEFYQFVRNLPDIS